MDCGGLTAASTTTTLDDFFSFQNTEVDVGVEWLSVFMEECLSSRGSCLPPPKAIVEPTTTSDPTSPSHPGKRQNAHLSFDNFAVAGKARSKRKRIAAANSKAPLTTPWSQSYHLTPAAKALDRLPSPDTPLLDQAYWLADSELIVPNKAAAEKRKTKCTAPQQGEEGGVEGKGMKGSDSMGIPQPRRCTHCLSQRTPQWRAGPLGPKTLCNACGVRYKSGRLLPEYRPAKSPTFVSYLHSNSHKKVMEMRIGMGIGAGAGTVSSTPAGSEEGS